MRKTQKPISANLPPTRRVLIHGRVIDVRGDGAVTMWRETDRRSPVAGWWLLASPAFREEIEQAEHAQGVQR